MNARIRAALATFIFATAFGAHAQRYFVVAQGSANQGGVGKIVSLSAIQTAPSSPSATGSVLLVQADTSGAYGDFALLGNVECLNVPADGSMITIGMQIVWGLGTALGRNGEAFYVSLLAGDASGPDQVDNSGFGNPRGPADCPSQVGTPHGPFASGGISITQVP